MAKSVCGTGSGQLRSGGRLYHNRHPAGKDRRQNGGVLCAGAGVSKNATEDEINTAYRKLIKQYHPDKYVGNPLADLAAEKIKKRL